MAKNPFSFPCQRDRPIFHRNISKSGMFSAPAKRPPKHHNLPAIHHKFTTKNHHKITRFLKNPLKKRHSTTPEKKRKNYFITFTGTPSGILISNWSFSRGWFNVSFKIVMVRLYWSRGRSILIFVGYEISPNL